MTGSIFKFEFSIRAHSNIFCMSCLAQKSHQLNFKIHQSPSHPVALSQITPRERNLRPMVRQPLQSAWAKILCPSNFHRYTRSYIQQQQLCMQPLPSHQQPKPVHQDKPEPRRCVHCGGYLQVIGSARKNGRPHSDWSNRLYHKKCWRELFRHNT